MIDYCRAYETARIAAYPAAMAALSRRETRPDIVYLWPDLRVTATPFVDRDVLLAPTDPQWRQFCAEQLGFTAVPAEFTDGG